MVAGAVVFTALSALLDRWAKPDDNGEDDEGDEGSPKLDKDAAAAERPPTAASTTSTAGLALLAAVTLDGVPENVALGVSLAREMSERRRSASEDVRSQVETSRGASRVAALRRCAAERAHPPGRCGSPR